MNKKKIFNEDELVNKKLKKCIYTSFGRLLHDIRNMSRLSLGGLQVLSSLNSGTVWKMEHVSNFWVLTFVQAFYHYMESMKCVVYIHHACSQFANALISGKCLVIVAVDSSELKNYDPHQILMQQNSADTEELERRHKHREKALARSKKLCENKYKKNQTAKKPAPKKKPAAKKNTKKGSN